MIFSEFKEKLQHERHRLLLAYWHSKIPLSRHLPGRRNIDPLDLPTHLSYIGLVDLLNCENGPRFQHRLAGTAIVDQAGRDPTGLWFEEAYEGVYLARAVNVFTRVAETAEPLLSHERCPLPDGQFLHYDKLILPLSSDGAEVDMMLYVVVQVGEKSVRAA